MKRKRKEKREKKKKVDRLSQKSEKMKKVYAQDKKVVKEKIQGEKAKEKTDRTLTSSKKNLEKSSSVSDTFCIICLERECPRRNLEAVYYMQILGSQVLCNFIYSI